MIFFIWLILFSQILSYAFILPKLIRQSQYSFFPHEGYETPRFSIYDRNSRIYHESKEKFLISYTDCLNCKFVLKSQSSFRNIHHYYYRQTLDDVEIYNADISIHVNEHNEIIGINDSTCKNVLNISFTQQRLSTHITHESQFLTMTERRRTHDGFIAL